MTFKKDETVYINPACVILVDGSSYSKPGKVVKMISKTRVEIIWEDGVVDNWYVGDLTKVKPNMSPFRIELRETSPED